MANDLSSHNEEDDYDSDIDAMEEGQMEGHRSRSGDDWSSDDDDDDN